MKLVIITACSIVLIAGLILAGYLLMPNKTSWADDYAQFYQTLPKNDPMRQQLKPMLADGKLSLWELSQIHCQNKFSCTIDTFVSTYTDPQSSDMLSEMTLQIFRARKS